MSKRSRRKKRKLKQRSKAAYAIVREDAQLASLIPTTPEGAVRDERVDGTSQSKQLLTSLVRRAIQEGWDVPDSAKMRIIAELLEPFYAVEKDYRLLASIARTLLMLDQTEWERLRSMDWLKTMTLRNVVEVVRERLDGAAGTVNNDNQVDQISEH